MQSFPQALRWDPAGRVRGSRTRVSLSLSRPRTIKVTRLARDGGVEEPLRGCARFAERAAQREVATDRRAEDLQSCRFSALFGAIF